MFVDIKKTLDWGFSCLTVIFMNMRDYSTDLEALRNFGSKKRAGYFFGNEGKSVETLQRFYITPK